MARSGRNTLIVLMADRLRFSVSTAYSIVLKADPQAAMSAVSVNCLVYCVLLDISINSAMLPTSFKCQNAQINTQSTILLFVLLVRKFI